MTCQCKYYLNLWFLIQNRIAYYTCVSTSSCTSACAQACAKVYLSTLNTQLKVVTEILTELKCPGFPAPTPAE